MGTVKVEHLVMYQGSRYKAVISVPVEWLADLTGYSAQGEVRTEKDRDSTLLFDLTPYLSVSAAQSLVLVDIPSDVTADLEWASGFYDMEISDGTPGHDVRFIQGTVKVDKEVTA